MNYMNIIKRFPARTGLVMLLAFIVVSILLLFKYAEGERERDLTHWQSRLGMLADMRRAALESELQSRLGMTRELAENPTLQLYLSQYIVATDKDDEILRAQFSHVRNLLAVISERFGFEKHDTSPVNTDASNNYGLAVLDNSGHLLAGTPGFAEEVTAHANLIKQSLEKASTEFIDVYATASGKPAYGFIMPVFQVQSLQSSQPVGVVVVLLDPQQHLFLQLQNTHLDTHSDETLLLRKQQNSLMFISPLQKDFTLFHQIPSENSYLAETLAWQQAGGFVTGLDYRGTKVLATGRTIKDTPWFLLQKIDAREALAESDRHQKFLFTSFLLLILLLAASFVAIWRHSTSVRLQQLASSLEAQTTLLNAVSDNIHELIFLLDSNKKVLFASQSLTHMLGIQPADATGKTLASLLGPDVASHLEHIIGTVDTPDIFQLNIGDNPSSYHVSRMVLQQGQYRHATLLVLHDVTALRSAQEKRDRLAQGIIATLVKAVDLHDPYCVDHSARTREVALCIADELKLEKTRRDALEMASLLANIGKLFLPREILTKMEPLTDAENELLKKHIDYAVDILRQLDFEGPVVNIIAQKNEYLDGSGYPHHLRGEALLTESRILAVANAFVAMTSARAYRHGRPLQEVLDILLQQCDSRYDRHVVAALFHIAENKADWQRWQTGTGSIN